MRMQFDGIEGFVWGHFRPCRAFGALSASGDLAPPPYAGCLGACGFFSVSDRKSTRLNSSHGYISYAVFCLKKKKIARKMGDIPVEPLTLQIRAPKRLTTLY